VLYAAYGQNIEFPTIDSYYNNISVGPDFTAIEPVHLEPEHVTDYEAGLRYSSQTLGLSGALGFYLENFTNTFITATDPSSNISTTFNAVSSQYKGIELQLAQDFGEQHFGQADAGDFTGYLNYSLKNAIFTNSKPLTISSVGNKNAVFSATVVKGDPAALVPEDEVEFGGTWSLDGWGANVDASYVTSQLVDQPATGTTSNLREPAYFLVNLGVNKTIPVQNFGLVKSVKFEFDIDIDNALNRTYDADADVYDESYNPKYINWSSSYTSIQEAAPQTFYGTIRFNF